jgi:Inner membrane component of T3SS, cytoplasmic domain
VSGVTFGKVFPLSGTSMVVGRQPECEICINSEEVSRRHAELRLTGDGVSVEDLGSANGTYINDKKITRELMRPGDELRFDTIRFMLLSPGADIAAGKPSAAAIAPTAPSLAIPASAGKTSPVIWIALVVAILSVALLVMKLMKVF